MKRFLSILLLGIIIMASMPNRHSFTVTDTYLSLGEYYNLFLDGSSNIVYHLLNTVPTACTNQPSGGAAWVEGGPHDAIVGDFSGGVYFLGSVFGGSAGALQHITVDSAGNSLPFVSGALATASVASPFWLDVIWTTDSTTGRQVGMAGSISGGIHGNGANTTVNQTSIVWVKFPSSVNPHIVKVVGQYCLLALSSTGQVWSWGGNNNKAMLMRGTSPSVSYLLPDTINLGGHHAIDIGSNGDVAAIVLDNGTILGGGDQPKYWGGPSASSSNTPQNFTSFLQSGVGLEPVLGTTFVPAKVYVNSGAIYCIGTDGSLASCGDNICGQIGNGQMFNMYNYKVSPAPNGSTPQPYAYDNGFGEDLISAWVRVCPGAHNWVAGYVGPSNCWNASFVNSLGEDYTWGRGKSMQTGNGRASCQYWIGGLNGGMPDLVNNPYPIKINLLSVTSGNIITVTSPYCILNSGYANCSQGTSCYNGGLAAPVIHPSKQYIGGASTATITPSITYASGSKELWNFVTFYSGPVTPISPYATGSSIPVSGMTTPGMYIFKDSSTDVMWKAAVAFDTIVVGCGGCLSGPQPIILHASNIPNEKVFLPADYRDAIYGYRPEFVSADNVQRRESEGRGHGDDRGASDGE